MNETELDNATAPRSVDQQQPCSAWSQTLPEAAGWWWIRGLNSHPPVQVVAVQQVCGMWTALIWGQWRPVVDFDGCEWAGPLAEPSEPNVKA